MSAYPLVVLIVSLAFCLAVFRQYQTRRRPYQLVWTISLAMAAAGSLAYVVFLDGGKSEWAFRVYYICGALLTAPLLGLGSLLLSARTPEAQRRMRPITAVVVAVCAVGALLLLAATVDMQALKSVNGGPGEHVFKDGPWLPFLIVSNIFGAVAVIGVALYSGWQLYKRRTSRQMMTANVLIALGTLVISQAGSQARTGLGAGAFWVVMTVGWVILFGGFLLTYRVQRAAAPAPAPQAIAGTSV